MAIKDPTKLTVGFDEETNTIKDKFGVGEDPIRDVPFGKQQTSQPASAIPGVSGVLSAPITAPTGRPSIADNISLASASLPIAEDVPAEDPGLTQLKGEAADFGKTPTDEAGNILRPEGFTPTQEIEDGFDLTEPTPEVTPTEPVPTAEPVAPILPQEEEPTDLGIFDAKKIEEAYQGELKAIQQKYSILQEEAKVEAENRRQQAVGGLSSVGYSNPLSSGFANIDSASRKELASREDNLRMQQSREEAAVLDKYYNRHLSGYKLQQEEKTEAKENILNLLSFVGIESLQGLTSESLNNMEKMVSWPTNSLVNAVKQMNEDELKGEDYQTTTFDGNLISYKLDPKTGELDYKILIKGESADKIKLTEDDQGNIWNISTNPDGSIKTEKIVEGSGNQQDPLTYKQQVDLEVKLGNNFERYVKESRGAINGISRIEAGWEEVKEIISSGEGSLNAPSQAMLVTFQKMLDPTSVVRESEYARSGTGLSLKGRLVGAYEKLAKGGAGVSGKDLKEFYDMSLTLLGGYNEQMVDFAKRTQTQAQNYGLNLENILTPDVLELLEEDTETDYGGYEPEDYNSMVEKYGQEAVDSIIQKKKPSGDGSVSFRHNNPLNIKFGNFAESYGATIGQGATDGGKFATFPDAETGLRAAKDLLKGSTYRNLSLEDAMRRWSGDGYGADVAPNLGNKKISQMTEAELDSLIDSMKKREGWWS